ncbi:dual specificity protein phosphatase 16 [Centropristis striata]|uniref:dual specificity protein phosphatase 16 n=1 Tax=Centropristis striata TaxID=184440 RepID=UPI0027E0C3FD|nr:dual specificity protein phosphatase 16 [Centropristis striata]
MSEHPAGPAGPTRGAGPVRGAGPSAAAGPMAAVQPIGAEALVSLLEGGLDRVVLIDSRPFVDYNSSHILEAVNVNCSKLMKRRLQQDKVQIAELLQHSAKKKLELQGDQDVVVYDQSSSDPSSLSSESFLSVLLGKLERSFPSVHLLSGGFSEFSHLFPGLCEGKSSLVPSCMSQPCLPVTNVGPTRILPHLYLGCQRDVLNKDLMQQNDIVYVLNASNTCPKPDFIPESHFLRVPVNDSFCEKILPWLDRSVEFIEKAKASNARVLVHCLAGISRSATIAIAYIMKRMDMSLDEAYRFVKEKRPTISPNFNFLGQLLDFEKKIKCPLGTETKLKSFGGEFVAQPDDPEPAGCPEAPGGPGPALLEPLTLPCVLADAPEERLLAQALSGLQLADGPEDSARLKRSFSLDIKSYGEPGGGAPHRVFVPHGGAGDAAEFFKPPGFKEATSKPCQFSPVEEVSEQSTPEQSPDKEEAGTPSLAKPAPAAAAAPSCSHPLHRSGSMEENATSFLFGLSRSQQHLAKPGPGGALKGWHSDILLGPVTVSTSSLAGGWYLSSDSTRFYSTSAILSAGGGGTAGFAAYSCSHGLEAVRRRSRQRTGDRGDSRRSWHEESSFEKQLKRRSCQMEFGDGMTDSRSREEIGKVGSQSSFSGSMEIIEVS